MELSNPALVEAMIGAEFDVKQAEAAYSDLTVTVQSAKFDKESAAAQVAADFQQAKIKAERDRQLAEQGLIPPLDMKLSAAQARDLERRNEIEEKRLGIIDRSSEAQLAAQRVKIDQFKAIYELKKQQVDELHVRAGVPGMLQQLGNTAIAATPPLEVGRTSPQAAFWRESHSRDKLKGQVRVSETEARHISIGQAAQVRHPQPGDQWGRNSRIDPAAVNGTVLVEHCPAGRFVGRWYGPI